MKQFKLTAAALVLTSAFLFGGCAKEEPKPEKDSTKVEETSPIIRTVNTDVKTLDLNKDEKVFQCPMSVDYEVISDIKEVCPKCKMDLEEIAVAEAQTRLASK